MSIVATATTHEGKAEVLMEDATTYQEAETMLKYVVEELEANSLFKVTAWLTSWGVDPYQKRAKVSARDATKRFGHIAFGACRVYAIEHRAPLMRGWNHDPANIPWCRLRKS